jgi:hypothetical protein
MRALTQVTELDQVQWDELQRMVPAAGYTFTDGMTRVCTTFGGPGNQERHLEIPLMVLAKLLARLAHVAHAHAPVNAVNALAELDPEEAVRVPRTIPFGCNARIGGMRCGAGKDQHPATVEPGGGHTYQPLLRLVP